jgi:nucleoid DNA-binding protein
MVNIKEVVRKVASETGLPLKEAGELVETVIETVKAGLLRHETWEIRGFGTFKVRYRKGKWARNVRKNAPVYVPGHFSPVFVPGRVLKEALNGGKPAVEKY